MSGDMRYRLVLLTIAIYALLFSRIDINTIPTLHLFLTFLSLIIVISLILGAWFIIPKIVSLFGGRFYWGDLEIYDNKYIIGRLRTSPVTLTGMAILKYAPTNSVVMDKDVKEKAITQITSLVSGTEEMAFVFTKIRDIEGEELKKRIEREYKKCEKKKRVSCETLRNIYRILTTYPTVTGQWFIIVRAYGLTPEELIAKLSTLTESVRASFSGIGYVRVVSGEELRIILSQLLFGRLGQISYLG
jgi:hypothetical protein